MRRCSLELTEACGEPEDAGQERAGVIWDGRVPGDSGADGQTGEREQPGLKRGRGRWRSRAWMLFEALRQDAAEDW